jgi:hypothetical protein
MDFSMKRFFAFFTLLLSVNAFAMFCPKDLKLINVGDSIEDVKKQCGAPDSETNYPKTVLVPQEWDYFKKALPTDTVNSKIAVNIKDNQIINITLTTSSRKKLLCAEAIATNNQDAIQANCINTAEEQINVSDTTICGKIIQVGDSTDDLQAACGKPDFINHSELNDKTEATIMTDLKYLTPTGAVTLVFEAGKLVQQK